MYRLVKTLAMVGTAAILLDTTPLTAQTTDNGGGRRNRAAQADGGNNARGNRANFDPAQAQQRQMDRYKEVLGITNDGEWKIVQERIQKVLEAQRETRGGAGMMGGRTGGRQSGGAQANTTQDTNNQQRPGRPGSEPNPAVDALQKALDDNASTEVVDAKLAALRDSRKAADAKLETARAALQKIVTRKQEARLVLMGLLK
jgi:hypothetical protein